jgi:hypothetical protein
MHVVKALPTKNILLSHKNGIKVKKKKSLPIEQGQKMAFSLDCELVCICTFYQDNPNLNCSMKRRFELEDCFIKIL